MGCRVGASTYGAEINPVTSVYDCGSCKAIILQQTIQPDGFQLADAVQGFAIGHHMKINGASFGFSFNE